MRERDEKDRSTVVVASRVSPRQRRLIQVAADAACLSVSRFVRQAADRAAREQLGGRPGGEAGQETEAT